MIIDTAVYADGRRTASESIEGAFQTSNTPESFAYIVLHEPQREELDPLAGGLGVDRARLERVMQHPRRAGIQPVEDLLCVWLACVGYPNDVPGLGVGWICILLGESVVVVLSFGKGLNVLEELRPSSEIRSDRPWLAPQFVLREIVDEVFDSYEEATEKLEDDITEAESAVFDGRSWAARRIHALTRVVIEFHQVTEPLAEAFDRFLERADAGSRKVLSPARHRIRHVTEKLDGFRDLLSSLLGLNITMVGQKISAWGAILLIPTVVGGVFGMNAETTLFWWVHGAYGLEALLVFMVLLSTLLYLAFKRSGWL